MMFHTHRLECCSWIFRPPYLRISEAWSWFSIFGKAVWWSLSFFSLYFLPEKTQIDKIIISKWRSHLLYFVRRSHIEEGGIQSWEIYTWDFWFLSFLVWRIFERGETTKENICGPLFCSIFPSVYTSIHEHFWNQIVGLLKFALDIWYTVRKFSDMIYHCG